MKSCQYCPLRELTVSCVGIMIPWVRKLEDFQFLSWMMIIVSNEVWRFCQRKDDVVFNDNVNIFYGVSN